MECIKPAQTAFFIYRPVSGPGLFQNLGLL